MSSCLYHESMSILEVWFYTMSPCLYRYTEIQITRINSNKFPNYRNITCKFTEMQIKVKQKYKIANWRNTTCRNEKNTNDI